MILLRLAGTKQYHVIVVLIIQVRVADKKNERILLTNSVTAGQYFHDRNTIAANAMIIAMINGK